MHSLSGNTIHQVYEYLPSILTSLKEGALERGRLNKMLASSVGNLSNTQKLTFIHHCLPPAETGMLDTEEIWLRGKTLRSLEHFMTEKYLDEARKEATLLSITPENSSAFNLLYRTTLHKTQGIIISNKSVCQLFSSVFTKENLEKWSPLLKDLSPRDIDALSLAIRNIRPPEAIKYLLENPSISIVQTAHLVSGIMQHKYYSDLDPIRIVTALAQLSTPQIDTLNEALKDPSTDAWDALTTLEPPTGRGENIHTDIETIEAKDLYPEQHHISAHKKDTKRSDTKTPGSTLYPGK